MKQIDVPVTIEFSQEAKDRIGTLTVDADHLPRNGQYVFAIGFKPRSFHSENGVLVYDDCELLEVSLVSDDHYLCRLPCPSVSA